MSYEYIVNIPSDKRSTFRALVKMMGGSLTRARRVEDYSCPNEDTLAAMNEAKSGVEMDAFDLNAFRNALEAL